MNKLNKTKYTFQSETKELLNIMIHSLYSNKEIFIRELISNASDAIEKMRFQFLSSKDQSKQYRNMNIRISLDKENQKIIISDNGIGMTKEEVIQNLGTIANSGTKQFLKSLNLKNIKNNDLIGKFGVGFYSSFIVSKKVIVKTRHNDEINEENSILWESDGQGTYSISNIIKKESGTEIELYLKKEEKIFLEDWKIQSIIKKYSDHINIPVEIQEYDKKNNTISWKQINKAKAIWTLKKSDIKEIEYKNFYKHITNDNNEPLAWSHNHVEGTQEYTILLYIPSKSTWNIWDRENKNNGLKLYVKKTYIMDDATQFLPSYLRFVKGILDSSNLPLNISREILQENYITQSLKKAITKKILSLLEKLSIQKKEQYKIFWKEFGTILKEGIAEDQNNQSKIASLIRFTSINSNDKNETLSLDQYIQNMQKKQNKIYFITADNYNSAITSPHIEIFKKKEIDVLLLYHKIDEWMMNYLIEFKGKKFQSINKIDEDIEKIFDKPLNSNIIQENMKEFLKKIKDTLNDKITSVKISYRLINTPAVLVLEKNSISSQMSKLFIAAGQNVPPIQYILEINPKHPLIKKISKLTSEKEITTWINILFDQTLLSEKGSLDNPNEFINNINQMFIK